MRTNTKTSSITVLYRGRWYKVVVYTLGETPNNRSLLSFLEKSLSEHGGSIRAPPKVIHECEQVSPNVDGERIIERRNKGIPLLLLVLELSNTPYLAS